MDQIDWRTRFLDLWHVSRNLQIALQFKIDNGNRKRGTDQAIETFGKQLDEMMNQIPDRDLNYSPLKDKPDADLDA